MEVLRFQVGAIETNAYLIYDENSMEGVVIDPGDEAERILTEIYEKEIKLLYILLTHGHFDHILAVHEISKKTGAKLVVHQEDAALLTFESAGGFGMFGDRSRLSYAETPVDILAKNGTEVLFGALKALYMHTPGHTPGSCVIKIEECLFTGDTVFRFECGRCDLPGGDFGKMLTSLKRIYDMNGDYKIYPGHGPDSTLAEERLKNPYMLQAVGK